MSFLSKLLIYVLLSTFLMVGARAQEPLRGIWCDTQIQVETVVVRGIELGDAERGVQSVNIEEPNACVFGTIVGIRGDPVSTLKTPEGLLDVVPVQVLAVLTPQGLITLLQPMTLFSLFESKRRDV